MDNPSETFLVARSCTWFNPKTEQHETCTLKDWREQAAYVLLGDPGMGKTEAFKLEAQEVGGVYLSARDFCDLQQKDDGKIFFIDGLDEMRSVGEDGRNPTEQDSPALKSIQQARFRLSCRAADWLGASDAQALRAVSPDGKIVELQLNPLTNEDVLAILSHKGKRADPASFIAQAEKHGLKDLLNNPQNLAMLVDAVKGNAWPASRQDVYKIACENLIKEHNHEHRVAQRSAHKPNSEDSLLTAAGYLCAIQLLSGLAGFATDDGQESRHFASQDDLLNPHNLPLSSALKSRIFQGDGNERCWPTHRSVAEFLAARFIATAIHDHGLPLGRVLALMSGSDGGIVSELRGLGAWLAVHCSSARTQLIERDPLGVVLYGDAKHFTVQEKNQVWEALRKEAERYTGFRSEHSLPHQFGTLGSRDMLESLREKLISPSRSDADQALLYCILDAIEHGDPMPELAHELESIFRDASYWSGVRRFAFHASVRVKPDNVARWLEIAKDIQNGIIADDDDELMGSLLHKLYPTHLSPEDIFDYFRAPKQKNLIGSYYRFFSRNLLRVTPIASLPILLDQLAARKETVTPVLARALPSKMPGKLLLQGLTEFGDGVSDQRLYDWLGVGLDQYHHIQLGAEFVQQIGAWLEQRPAKYQAILLQGVIRHVDQSPVRRHEHKWLARHYKANPPSDMVDWYLERASEQSGELAEYYFTQAVYRLRQIGGKDYLTSENLVFLQAWLQKYAHFQKYLDPFLVCQLDEWRQENAITDRKYQTEQQEFKASWRKTCRENQAVIREGKAHYGIFAQLADIYLGKWQWEAGASSADYMKIFFAEEDGVLDSVYEGFRQVVLRDDLPSADQIIQAAANSQGYSLGTSCLIGMALRFADDAQSALQLDDKVLSRLIAFHFVSTSDDDPAWFSQLLQERPELVASVMSPYVVAMLHAKKAFVQVLSKLANDETYAKLAPIVLPEILRAFPLRASEDQVCTALGVMLKAGLEFLAPPVLLELIAQKLQLTSLDIAQRVYWLACGLVLAPEMYEQDVLQTVGNQQVRATYLAQFFYFGRYQSLARLAELPVSTRKLLIEILAGDYAPDSEPMAIAGNVFETVELLRNLIAGLGNTVAENAEQALEHLLAQPQLASWQQHFRAALYAQRALRRKASFQPAISKEVCNMLANLAPASAADLAALVGQHLRDIGLQIRDASTDDYKQYWSYSADNKQLEKSKPENDCRDTLLSDLLVRLNKLNVEAIREGSYAENKRADIRVSYHANQRSWNIPIEIKKSTHADLWTAMQQQLIPRYVRDPQTDGYGIYLVFWFGEKGMRLGPNAKRPTSAAQLEEMLRATLTAQEQAHIQVCVIDCALPQKSEPKKKAVSKGAVTS